MHLLYVLKVWLQVEEGTSDDERWDDNDLLFTNRLNWSQPHNLLSLPLVDGNVDDVTVLHFSFDITHIIK